MLILLVFLLLPFQDVHWNANSKGIAIDGYDPVSYFLGSPLKGDKIIAYQHEGVTFYFASNSNRVKFITNPTKYLPQYGGFCAYAMGDTGEKVEVDPETFKVLNGKLYLFYNAWGNNTLKSWNQEEAQLLLQADKNWKKYTATDR